ncbi:MAG: KEOPS complex subunit Cgi121 [Candidatus Helarchaeota archaeon]
MIVKKFIENDLKYRLIGITAISIQKVINIQDIFNRIKQISNESECEIQLLNANIVATWEHIFFAAINALNSFKNGNNLANNLSLEILLYIAGTRQIKVALKKVGINNLIREIAIVIFSNDEQMIYNVFEEIKRLLSGVEDIKLLEINEKKFINLINLFNINYSEISNLIHEESEEAKFQVIPKIIIDRGSMIALEK